MLANETVIDDVKVIRCQSLDIKDQRICELHCIDKGFRTGFCEPVGDHYRCVCYDD